MVKGSHYEYETVRNTEENESPQKPRDDRRADLRGRKKGQCRRDMSPRGHRAESLLSVAPESQGERDSRPLADRKTRSEGEGPREAGTDSRDRAAAVGALRGVDRASASQKKRGCDLHGSLKNRHLTADVRRALVEIIDKARAAGASVKTICATLEVTPRAYYRWRDVDLSDRHGGGGGWNKLTPVEEQRIVAYAKKHPEQRCRRIAYSLERQAKAFVGKSKVAEVLKSHGLNHEFERRPPKPYIPPGDMMLHEPRAKNLVWGMDWTWVKVDERHMFLLVLLDWYSRKILAWGFFKQITSHEVVAVVTDAVAAEKIDSLPDGALRPLVVADHGSANTAEYTRTNIEVQGLQLWLSGIGRPTGNARTERVIGTLKWEEITLQDCYVDEDEARRRIGYAIWDYNFQRPNTGVGGFAPNFIHAVGRAAATKRRQDVRGTASELRYSHWEKTRLSQKDSTYPANSADL